MKKIDAHAHYGMWNFPIPDCGTTDNLLRLCEQYDITRAACSSALAILYNMEEGNAELAAAFEPHEQLLGYVYVNPNFIAESVAEMERYLPQKQFVGTKIYTGGYSGVGADARIFSEMVDEVARLAGVILVHCGSYAVARTIAGYAEKHPGLSFILGHAGGTECDRVAELAAANPNIFMEFCCSWAGEGKIARAVERCGPQQIVFGTDMDLIDPAFMIGMYETAGLSDDEKRMIYYDNAAALFGLPGYAAG